MMRLAFAILSSLAGVSPLNAATLLVSGSGTLLSVAEKAQDGDTVLFAPGTYYECAAWRANRLTLRAQQPGQTIFDGVACEDKAVFVIKGNATTVDGLVFKNVQVPDHNGAGIRLEGSGLTVLRSRFLNNQEGILTSAESQGEVRIENSVFDGNGNCDAACAHGIYINTVDRLVVRRSTFINTHVGHHIKSRAKTTLIEDCVIDDGPKGNSSYLIEIPFGGTLSVYRSRLIKGPHSDNRSTFISYAFEGLRNPVGHIIVDQVHFINKLRQRPYLFRGAAGPPPVFRKIHVTGEISGQFSR